MQHITHNSNCWTVQLFCCFTTQGQDCCLSVIMITQRVFVTTHTLTKKPRKLHPRAFIVLYPQNKLSAFCTPNAKSSRIRNQESVRDILGSPDSDFELRMSGVYRWDSFVRVHYSKNNSNNNSKSKQSKLSTDTHTHSQWLPREFFKQLKWFQIWSLRYSTGEEQTADGGPGTKLRQKFN